MALATGPEVPTTAIAQLGQLDNPGRARFGRGTLAFTIGIIGAITIGRLSLGICTSASPVTVAVGSSP